jgi:hypothetical protein
MPTFSITRIVAGLVVVMAAVVVAPTMAAAATSSDLVQYLEFRNAKYNKCLDVAGQDNGSKVQQYTCNATVNQEWHKAPTDSGFFMLQVASSGRCLEVPNASLDNDAIVDISDCTGAFNQQWTLANHNNTTGDQLVVRHSGKCLAILFEDPADRAQAVQYDCDSGLTERWKNQVAAYYTPWRNYGSPRCLDVAGRVNGSRVQQYTCNGTVNQQWTLTSTDSGYAIRFVASSGRCLQVPDSSQAEDAVVTIADCTGAFNQQWRTVLQATLPDGQRVVSLQVRHSGKCLTILGESQVDRVTAVQHTCSPSFLHSQQWINSL